MLITSVSGVVSVLGLALIFSLLCRKRAESRGSLSSCPSAAPAQVKLPGHLVNLDSVSLESQEPPDTSQTFEKPSLSPVTLSTFQNNSTEISMLLPPSSSASNASSSSAASCGGSTQFLQDLRTLDEKYSLVSSTPSVPSSGLLDKSRMMGRFQTFSESTLLESISEADSELGLRTPGGCPRPPLSSLGGSSATFSLDTERHERSFDHFSHHHHHHHPDQDPGAGCGDHCHCENSVDQNLTFII